MKITKSFFKNSNQRNVRVYELYYNKEQIEELKKVPGIFTNEWLTGLRLDLSYVDKIEVAVSSYDSLSTQATLKNGGKVWVRL